MRFLIVTLIHRQYGPAWASWAKALRYWLDEQPEAQFDHIKMYGGVQLPDDFNHHDPIIRKYQDAQRIFLAGDWDAMVCLEDDIVLPTDAFPRLIAVLEGGADIAYGLYCWRQGVPKLSAYTDINEARGISLSSDKPEARRVWGSVIDVAGVGLGFTAIRRNVLETVRFRRGGAASNDWYLALDARVNNFIQRCDMGLHCGHMTLEPSPRIIYPDVNEPDLYRVDFL